MARPSKSVDMLQRHATKAEKEGRRAAEKALLTGKPMHALPQVKANAAAYREFRRVLPLMKAIGRNDALYENIINRYCMLVAECAELQEMKDANLDALRELEQDPTVSNRYEIREKLQKAILDADRRIQGKRKMLFDIEKENAMTVAASLRSVPKAPQENDDPLLQVLMGE